MNQTCWPGSRQLQRTVVLRPPLQAFHHKITAGRLKATMMPSWTATARSADDRRLRRTWRPARRTSGDEESFSDPRSGPVMTDVAPSSFAGHRRFHRRSCADLRYTSPSPDPPYFDAALASGIHDGEST